MENFHCPCAFSLENLWLCLTLEYSTAGQTYFVGYEWKIICLLLIFIICDGENNVLSSGTPISGGSGISMNCGNYTSDVPIVLVSVDILLIFIDHNQRKKKI